MTRLPLARPAVLLAALLAVGCARGPLAVLPGAVADAVSFDAASRSAIGGAAYSGFHIAPELDKARDSRLATKLTYLMTDEVNHQSDWSLKMLAMMGAWTPKAVHNVIFRDGKELNDTRMYYLNGQAPDKDGVRGQTSLVAPGVTEVQSNNPQLFSQVVGWTFANYPAKKRYLQLYTHGAGVFGVGCDEKQTDLKGKLLPDADHISVMNMPDFGEALRQGLKGRQLDLLYFRACLMSNVEALYEIADTTRYVIASEEVSGSVDNSNLTMTQQFEDLAEQDVEPAEVARQMAIQAHAKHPEDKAGNYSGYETFAALDLSKMSELHTAIDSLAVTLMAAMPAHGAEILAAYDATPTYNAKPKPTAYYEQDRDLWAFTAALLHGVNDPAIQAAAARVRSVQTALMIHEKDAFGSASNGLSIFMPARTDAAPGGQMAKYLAGGYTKLKFAKSGPWLKFLNTMAQAK